MTDTDRRSTDRRMADVNYTHPHADPAAANRPFERGPTVLADGGEPDRRDAEDDADDEDPTPRMKDVDQTPPDENRDVNRVFERGGAEEPVESEE